MTRQDHRAARRSLPVFAEMIGLPMTDWQADSLRLDSRSTVLVAGRQLGKTRSLSLLALWWAFRQPGQTVLIVSAGEEAARRLLTMARRFATGSPLLSGSVVDESASLIRLTNGSEIRSVPSSERQVRGLSVDLLLIDEASMVPDDLLLSAAFPTTSARPNSRIVLASTPLAADGGFYRQAMAGMDGGSEQVRTFTWKAMAAGGDRDAPWITREVIAHQEATLPSDRYRREYQCEWAATSDVLLTPGVLESCSADFDLPELKALRGPVGLLAGVDWAGGTGRDRTVLAAIARLPISGDPVWVGWIVEEWQETPIHVVSEQVARAHRAFHLMTTESNGLGLPATDELREAFTLQRDAEPHIENGWHRAGTTWNPLAMNATRKADGYFRLKTMLERGQLLIARQEGLIRELAGLRVEYRLTGSIGIEAGASSGHDDRADALMLATAPWPKDKPDSVLSRMARNAEPVTPVEDSDTILTGGGREVPRRPTLLSVSGDHLTPRDSTQPARSEQDDVIHNIRAGMAGRGEPRGR